ncbi:MAG: hypothetical protein IPP32_15325 [Bacteroidetes bacterium]|nr:hypothetical protein [Bacteroidota bacterium]
MMLTALFIGFYGYLFPGNINLMVMDLYRSRRYVALLWVLLLILVFESLYCGGTLLFIEALKKHQSTFSVFQVVSFILLIVMGVWVLFDNKKEEQKFSKNTLKRGLISIVFHPQQIPFWMVIGIAINPLSNYTQFIPFLFFNALGTLLVMLTYMILGNQVLNFLKLNIIQVARMFAFVYIAIGTFSILKILV